MDMKSQTRRNTHSFVFPDCWENDERMNFLFQPFSDRSTNTLAFDNKLKFWKMLVDDICHSNLFDNGESAAVLVTQDKLCNLLKRKGSSPKCLPFVLAELVKDGVLFQYQEYRTELVESVKRSNASWSAWGYQLLITSPLKKLTDKMVSAVSPKRNDNAPTSYVVVGNLRKVALNFLKLVEEQSSCGDVGAEYRLIQTHSSLVEKFSAQMHDLDLILLWLQAQGLAVKVPTERLGDVYRFCTCEGEKVGKLSDIELGVLELKETREKLTMSIHVKQSKVDEYLQEIKSLVLKKRKHLAVQALRRKKALDANINRDMEHVHKLDCVLDEIYQSSTNQLVLRAYERGAAALKSLTDATRLEQVDATMDSLASSLAASEELSAALSSPTVESTDADQLEKELEELLAEKSLVDESSENVLLAKLDDLTVVDGLPVGGVDKHAHQLVAS